MAVFYECRVLSGRGFCDGPISRPEESYRMCMCVCVCVCVRERERERERQRQTDRQIRYNNNPLLLQ